MSEQQGKLPEEEMKTYRVQGFTCTNCAAIFESNVKGLPGVEDAKVNFGASKVYVKGDATIEELEKAGAFAVVLECVPAKLAEIVTKELNIPTIGIGAGAQCDGQVLVYQDMIGMFSGFTPKFVKRYANIGDMMKEAFEEYNKEVKNGSFPSQEHTFKISEDVIEKLY